MGKTLKFPKRQKYIAPQNKAAGERKEEVSEEEHRARIEMLKKLGLVKDDNS